MNSKHLDSKKLKAMGRSTCRDKQRDIFHRWRFDGVGQALQSTLPTAHNQHITEIYYPGRQRVFLDPNAVNVWATKSFLGMSRMTIIVHYLATDFSAEMYWQH